MTPGSRLEELREKVDQAKEGLRASQKAKASAKREGELEEGGERFAGAIEAAERELFEAERALAIWEKNETDRGVAPMGDEIVGVIAVKIVPGMGSDARTRAIDEALAVGLTEAATALGGVLAAAPVRYTRERPGRDHEGNTVLDVHGRLEGDNVVPVAPAKPKRRAR